MTEQLNKKALKQYIREIKRLLICDGKTKRKFVKSFKADVEAYMEEQDVTDLTSLYTAFGEPIDIARGFFETADIKQIKKKMNVTKIVLCGVVAALLVWTATMTYLIIDNNRPGSGYGITTIVKEDGTEEVVGIEYD